jgi:hypothetical protein
MIFPFNIKIFFKGKKARSVLNAEKDLKIRMIAIITL